MASSYFKLKILKRKRCNIIKGRRDIGIYSERYSLHSEEYSTTNKKNKCRICLLDGVIPIFSDSSKILVESIKIFGDIEISEDDNMPKYLCSSCYTLLQNAILFRKKAQETNLLLRKHLISKVEYSPFLNDIADNLNDDSTKAVEVKENSKESTKYRCEICNIQFRTWKALVLHNSSKQHKNVRIQCPICNSLLTTKLYKKHLLCHNSASHLVCDVCGKLYRKDNLFRHLQLHNHELPFLCKICPYRGRFQESLKLHMRTHTGHKPFACDRCKLSFLTRSNLNRHLLTHNKQKPFKCGDCGRGFYIKRDMDNHFTTDHVGIKDFGCKTCGNRYGSKKGLLRHEIRVHKREKMAKGRMPLYLLDEYK